MTQRCARQRKCALRPLRSTGQMQAEADVDIPRQGALLGRWVAGARSRKPVIESPPIADCKIDSHQAGIARTLSLNVRPPSFRVMEERMSQNVACGAVERPSIFTSGSKVDSATPPNTCAFVTASSAPEKLSKYQTTVGIPSDVTLNSACSPKLAARMVEAAELTHE